MKYSFSVIVPIYKTDFNQLELCISSLIEQDHDLLTEIILVDDGNNEKYKQTLVQLVNTKFKDYLDLIKLINLKNNKGLANARKCGYELSSGQIIIFVDSDDWICDSQFLNKMNKYFKAYPNIDAVKHSIKRIVNNKIAKEDSLNKDVELKQIKLTINNFFDNKKYFEWCYQMLQGYVFKRECINHSIMWNTIKDPHEDEYFFSCLMLKELNILITNEKFYCYRILNPGSITSSYVTHTEKSKNDLSKQFNLRLIPLEKWFTTFDNYNIYNSSVARDFWHWLCIMLSINTGVEISRKNIKFFPTNKECKRLIKKYNLFKNERLSFLKLIYIYIVLSSKLLDRLLSKIYRKLRK